MQNTNCSKKTHTSNSKWYVVKSDNKKLARLHTIKLILNTVKYHGRTRSLDFKPDKKIIIPGDVELKNMKKERKLFGKFLT